MTHPEMTPREFEESARRAFLAVEESLDALAADEIELDVEENVLTIGFAGGDRFVLNVNGPAREIWLSANRRAWHFAPRADGRYCSTAADGEELRACLARLIGEKLGRTIALGE
jgi:CyaY protein